MMAAVMVFLLLAAGVVQSLTPAAAWLASTKTPLLLGVAVYYALAHGRGAAAAAAAIAGLLQDSLSLIPVGYSALCFVAFALTVHRLRGVLFRDSVVTVAALGAVLGALTTLALYAMLRMGPNMAAVPGWWLLLKLCGSALLGMLAAPVVWGVAGAIERQVGIEPERDE